MHELSIASAILDGAKRLTPAATVLRAVALRVGPLRCIEPHAMLWAWKGVTSGTAYDGVELELEVLPWHLRCRECGREYDAEELDAPCACGAPRASPVGGDELQIVSLTVDKPSEKESNRTPPPGIGPSPKQPAAGDLR